MQYTNYYTGQYVNIDCSYEDDKLVEVSGYGYKYKCTYEGGKLVKEQEHKYPATSRSTEHRETTTTVYNYDGDECISKDITRTSDNESCKVCEHVAKNGDCFVKKGENIIKTYTTNNWEKHGIEKSYKDGIVLERYFSHGIDITIYKRLEAKKQTIFPKLQRDSLCFRRFVSKIMRSNMVVKLAKRRFERELTK